MKRTTMVYYRKLLSCSHEIVKNDVSSYISLSEYSIFNVVGSDGKINDWKCNINCILLSPLAFNFFVSTTGI